MASTECPICYDKFNRSSHKQVECPNCQAHACSSCIEQYFLTTPQDPHCMSCRHGWNTEFLSNILTKTFINGRLRQHRENVLFDRERALLPATQPLLQQRRDRLALQDTLKQLKQQKVDLKRRLVDLNEEIHDTTYMIWHGIPNNNAEPRTQERRFTFACPITDCKGYIEETGGSNTCGTCSAVMCSKCREVKGSGHECDPRTVETVKQLKKDTKPCPSCHSLIYRSEGCSQMFCTVCEHVFDWNTGQADSGPIHNPEWYALQARLNRNGQAPRDPRDMPCGGLVHWATLQARLRELQNRLRPPHASTFSATIRDLLSVHRVTQHLEHVELPRFLANNNLFMRNATIRVDYLENKLSDSEFKRLLLLSERAHDRQEAIHNLVHVFVLAAQDIFRRVQAAPAASAHTAVDEILLCMDEFYTLQDFYHEYALKISARFNNCTVPSIDIESGIVR